MRKVSYAVLTLLLVGACTVYHHGRYGGGTVVAFEPEFWGTVTYVDPVAHRIDLDYVAEGGRHLSRAVYFDERATRWDGVRYTELHSGDQVVVRGRNARGRYRVESVRRH